MLNARNVIALTLIIGLLSLIWTVLDLASPPKNDGRGFDSLGTRHWGYRALFETLERLEVPVERVYGPPSLPLLRQQDGATTPMLVLLMPDSDLVMLEPEHLGRVRQWVREGGTVFAGPPLPMDYERFEFAKDTTLLAELGLPEVAVQALNAGGEERDHPRWVMDKVQRVRTRFGGEWAWMRDEVRTLSAYQGDVASLVPSEAAPEPLATLHVQVDDDSTQTLVGAVYPVGEGRVVVLGDPRLLSNANLPKEDNVLLAVGLLGQTGRPLLVDAFYHGLTVRGNPAWLLTQPQYAMVAVLVVAGALLVIWRFAVPLGPPLPDEKIRRRNLGEYVEAMALLFHRSGHRAFVLREVRDGVLALLARRFHLPSSRATAHTIATLLERRDPARAALLREAAAEAERLLEPAAFPGPLDLTGRRHYRRAITDATRKLTQCL